MCAEKSDTGAEYGEIVAPTSAWSKSDDGLVVGLRAMNMLRIPESKPRKARSSRKRRETSQTARLELTLEMPAHPRAELVERSEGEVQEPERGVAEVDFYI